MSTAMQHAMTEAMPEARERVRLARRIESIEQVRAMTTEELDALAAEHDTECVSLTGKLEAADPGAHWVRGGRQALRVLRLHRGWIVGELKARRAKAARAEHRQVVAIAAESREAGRREAAERVRQSEAARLARIKASNDETAQNIAVFKETAREVLGAEMYEHLWELTRQRIAALQR